jgi:hypothetical protein
MHEYIRPNVMNALVPAPSIKTTAGIVLECVGECRSRAGIPTKVARERAVWEEGAPYSEERARS